MSKFNVGDKVRMISTNPTFGLGYAKTGDIGIVRSVFDDTLRADFPNHRDWLGYEHEFELVDEHEVSLAPGGGKVIPFPLQRFEDSPAPVCKKAPVHTDELEGEFGLEIDATRVIYADPATVLFYIGSNGQETKVVAKCSPLDTYDEKRGLEAAILKAVLKEAKKMLAKM